MAKSFCSGPENHFKAKLFENNAWCQTEFAIEFHYDLHQNELHYNATTLFLVKTITSPSTCAEMKSEHSSSMD